MIQNYGKTRKIHQRRSLICRRHVREEMQKSSERIIVRTIFQRSPYSILENKHKEKFKEKLMCAK